MITILLETIINILQGWIDSFNSHAQHMEDKIDSIDSTASDIKTDTDNLPDIKDNTAAVITPIQAIKSNTDSISTSSSTTASNTTAILNNIGTISTNTGSAASFAEDCANNTLNILDKVTTIASDTTNIRSNISDLDSESSKIYEAIKWLLADKTIEATDSGNSPLSFDTDIADDLISCKVGLVAQQSGSGDPSISNPRAISGYSSVGLSLNGAAATIALGDTYYNGVLDVVSGNLSLTSQMKRLDTASAIYTAATSGNGIRMANFLPTTSRLINGICNMAIISTNTTTNTAGKIALGIDNRHLYWFGILDILGYTTTTEMQTWLDNNAVYVLFDLPAPVEVTLTPQQLTAIAGVNTITSDTNGNIEVTYTESIKKYLDKLDNQ